MLRPLTTAGLIGRAEHCAEWLLDRGSLGGRHVAQLVDACTKQGEPDRAETMFRNFVRRLDLLPEEEVFLYNLLLRGFRWSDRVGDVERLEEEMLSRGLTFDRCTIGTAEQAPWESHDAPSGC